jgi:diacylglycerol kinase family enzyme
MSATPVVEAAEAAEAGEQVVAIVVNTGSGALLRDPTAHRVIEQAFAAAGLRPIFIPPDAGDLKQRMRLALAEDAAAVVVAGGDGSIMCAAEVLIGSKVTLGIIPMGTMNVLARDLGLPLGDVAAAATVIANGTVQAIDVGRVNGRYFLCGAMLGLPARLARFRESGRHMPALRLWLRFARAAFRAFSRYAPLSVAMTTEGGFKRMRVSSLMITPNPLSEGVLLSLGRTRLNGGVLAVYAFRRLGLGDAIRLFVRALFGHWQADPVVTESLVRRVAIAVPRRSVRVMLDGEVQLMRPPLRFRILPGALRVIVPADESRDGEAPTVAEPAAR